MNGKTPQPCPVRQGRGQVCEQSEERRGRDVSEQGGQARAQAADRGRGAQQADIAAVIAQALCLPGDPGQRDAENETHQGGAVNVFHIVEKSVRDQNGADDLSG